MLVVLTSDPQEVVAPLSTAAMKIMIINNTTKQIYYVYIDSCQSVL